jgi:AraC-like DNA-binding protein
MNDLPTSQTSGFPWTVVERVDRHRPSFVASVLGTHRQDRRAFRHVQINDKPTQFLWTTVAATFATQTLLAEGFHLGNSVSFRKRVNLLNKFLLLQMPRSPSDLSSLHRFRTFLQGGDQKTIAQVSKDVGMSQRQMERKSLEYFGVSPTMLTRLSRFHRALRLAAKRSGSWLHVAHASDYYDQMHMVRDFRTFAGGAPGKSFASIEPHHLINFQ